MSRAARFTDKDPVSIAAQAAKAASECEDDYQRSAVRSWEIVALAERGFLGQAEKALSEALNLAKTVPPFSSRSEALYILFQAAFAIDRDHAIVVVNDVLNASCPLEEHWRCQRAIRDAGKIADGEFEPRKFF
ncbi:MAG: hypothetical protein ACI8T1_003109 [Verrucomicrobiales bacterium]